MTTPPAGITEDQAEWIARNLAFLGEPTRETVRVAGRAIAARFQQARFAKVGVGLEGAGVPIDLLDDALSPGSEADRTFRRLTVLIAGRVAEGIIFGDVVGTTAEALADDEAEIERVGLAFRDRDGTYPDYFATAPEVARKFFQQSPQSVVAVRVVAKAIELYDRLDYDDVERLTLEAFRQGDK